MYNTEANTSCDTSFSIRKLHQALFFYNHTALFNKSDWMLSYWETDSAKPNVGHSENIDIQIKWAPCLEIPSSIMEHSCLKRGFNIQMSTSNFLCHLTSTNKMAGPWVKIRMFKRLLLGGHSNVRLEAIRIVIPLDDIGCIGKKQEEARVLLAWAAVLWPCDIKVIVIHVMFADKLLRIIIRQNEW